MLGVAVLVVAGVVVWLTVRGSGSTAPASGPAPIIALPGHQVCADQVRISVRSDERMTEIADQVRNDARVRTVYTETQQQAFAHYEQEFANQPAVATLAHPGSLPASVLVVPVSGTDAHQLADVFRQEFADAEQVQATTRADAARAVAAAGMTDPAPPCPASGEFPSR